MEEPSPRLSLGMVAAGLLLAALGLLVDEPLRQAVVILGLMVIVPAVLAAGWGRVRPSSLKRDRP